MAQNPIHLYGFLMPLLFHILQQTIFLHFHLLPTLLNCLLQLQQELFLQAVLRPAQLFLLPVQQQALFLQLLALTHMMQKLMKMLPKQKLHDFFSKYDLHPNHYCIFYIYLKTSTSIHQLLRNTEK